MNAMITWRRAVDELPDDDTEVLIALDDDRVFPGFFDGGEWHDGTGWPLEHGDPGRSVVWWADYPEPPK